MVTGASTRCTFASSTNSSTAFSHSSFTSASRSGSQRLSCAGKDHEEVTSGCFMGFNSGSQRSSRTSAGRDGRERDVRAGRQLAKQAKQAGIDCSM